MAGARTRAAEVKIMVENDLESHCVVADTDGFLDHYFNISSEVVEKVYNKMVRLNLYEEREKKWKTLPQNSSKESAFYLPLITICEAIRKAHDNRNNRQYDCRWFMRSDNTPKSHNVTSSLIRPDVFLLLGMEGEADEWEKKLEKLKDNHARLIKFVEAWWLRVCVIIEVKPKDDPDIVSCVTQLMIYLRQVLREQLDRWFVPGLLLTGTQLAAWVVDRSGAFGTQKSFDFHKEPRRFIQVILACSMLAPTRLGWDTTMKLWKQPSPLHSFSERINIENYAETADGRRWVFEMPVRNENFELDGKRGLFVTTKALSIFRAQSIEGRTTVVWAVQRLEGGKVTSDEIFVLKQCWRPITAVPEGDLYPPCEEAEKHHIGRVYSYEDVMVTGLMINTHQFIRGGLEYKDPIPESYAKSNNRKRGADTFEIVEKQEGYLFIVPEADHDPLHFNFRTTAITGRVLSRTLLFRSHGWALHCFSDRPELVRICDNVVEALEFLYFRRKTLQRDISLGNVLISSTDGVINTQGCLIDFDNAKVVKETKLPIIHKTRDWALNRRQKRNFLEFSNDALPPRAAHVLAFYNDSYSYLRRLKTIVEKPLLPADEANISEEDIGFLSDENIQIPYLEKRRAQTVRRNVTLPFASSEVLNAERLFDSNLYPEDESGNVKRIDMAPHDARHDIEALFWCITYICVTREGPGGKRREELRPEFDVGENARVIDLRRINYCFFSSDVSVLIPNKTRLFKVDDYNDVIVCHFHPYFEPLKPLMRQWWNILCFAHRYPIFETIHKTLRKTLASTLEALKKQPLSHEDFQKTEKVIQQRTKELEELQHPSDHFELHISPEESPWDRSLKHDRNLRSPRVASRPLTPTPRPQKMARIGAMDSTAD